MGVVNVGGFPISVGAAVGVAGMGNIADCVETAVDATGLVLEADEAGTVGRTRATGLVGSAGSGEAFVAPFPGAFTESGRDAGNLLCGLADVSSAAAGRVELGVFFRVLRGRFATGSRSRFSASRTRSSLADFLVCFAPWASGTTSFPPATASNRRRTWNATPSPRKRRLQARR